VEDSLIEDLSEFIARETGTTPGAIERVQKRLKVTYLKKAGPWCR
jgi:hypothetical protein